MPTHEPRHFANPDLLRGVIDSMFAFVAVIAPDGTLVEVNRAPLEAAGLRREDVLGRPLADASWFREPAARAQVLRVIDEALEGRVVREDFTISVTGGSRVVDGTLSRIMAGDEVVAIVGSAVDITRRKKAETALRESEERFRELTETIEETFWLVDLEHGRTLYVSPGYERTWGLPRDELYASPMAWLKTVHPDDRERVARAIANHAPGQVVDEEYRITRPDGAMRWVRSRGFPVHDAAGRMVRVAGVSEDITERRELEQQLRHAQKMESIGRLAGGIAHDFNNLLLVVASSAEILAERVTTADDKEIVEDVRVAAERAASLTRQLLLFSRRQAVEPKDVDIDAAVREAERMLRRLLGEDIVFEVRLACGDCRVRIDPGSLTQVLLNLSLNARDAMPGGGTLTITTTAVDVDAAMHPAIRAGRYVRLSLSDTGTGMTREVAARVFDPFFTTKEVGRGSGLGLAVVHGIVTRAGGFVDVDTEPHRGTTFRIYFPAGEPAVTAETPSTERPTRGTETVLLVEDDAPVRRLIARGLVDAGYTVLQAGDGFEAVQLAEASDARVDLLVTDVVLPKMTGDAVADRLRARLPDLRVLFMSGYTDEEIVRRGVLQSDAAFIQKPHTCAALLAKVREILDADA